MQKITFYQRFETDISSGKKTITIRGASENHFTPRNIVQACTYEDARKFALLEILSVEPILFKLLNKYHAQQENMSLSELKKTIQGIYPNTQQLYVVSFRLIL